MERVEPEEVIEEEQGEVAEPDDTEAPPAKKRKLKGHRLPVLDAIISTSKSPHLDLFNVLLHDFLSLQYLLVFPRGSAPGKLFMFAWKGSA